MSFLKWTILSLLLLPVAETVAFLLVVLAFGWMWAIFLFVASSVAGVNILRRTGRSDFNRFLAALKLEGVRAIHLNTPGLGPMLGAILLVFPGFLTDIVGALLFIPPLRRWAVASIGRRRKQQRAERNPSLIELEPNQWREITDATRTGKRP